MVKDGIWTTWRHHLTNTTKRNENDILRHWDISSSAGVFGPNRLQQASPQEESFDVSQSSGKMFRGLGTRLGERTQTQTRLCGVPNLEHGSPPSVVAEGVRDSEDLTRVSHVHRHGKMRRPCTVNGSPVANCIRRVRPPPARCEKRPRRHCVAC